MTPALATVAVLWYVIPPTVLGFGGFSSEVRSFDTYEHCETARKEFERNLIDRKWFCVDGVVTK